MKIKVIKQMTVRLPDGRLSTPELGEYYVNDPDFAKALVDAGCAIEITEKPIKKLTKET